MSVREGRSDTGRGEEDELGLGVPREGMDISREVASRGGRVRGCRMGVADGVGSRDVAVGEGEGIDEGEEMGVEEGIGIEGERIEEGVGLEEEDGIAPSNVVLKTVTSSLDTVSCFSVDVASRMGLEDGAGLEEGIPPSSIVLERENPSLGAGVGLKEREGIEGEGARLEDSLEDPE